MRIKINFFKDMEKLYLDQFHCLKNANGFYHLFNAIHMENSTRQKFFEARIRSHLTLLFSDIYRRISSREKKGEFTSEQKNMLLAYVSQNVNQNITPPELAKILNYSHDYFRKIFHKSMGISCREWLIHERIKSVANVLISSSSSLKDIAKMFNCRDQYFFSKQFKKFMKMTPTGYRHKYSYNAKDSPPE